LVYVLAAGQALVGSSPSADLVLPVRGISRRHARLVAVGEAVVVEDQGSKNGTFLNGARISREVAVAGDALRFGPVAVRLEALAGDDDRLAIVLEAGAEGDHEDVTEWLGEPVPPLLASELFERLVELLAAPEPGIAPAFASVVEAAGAAGGALGEWRGAGEPAILCSYGDFGGHLEDPGLYRFFGRIFVDSEAGPVIRCGRLSEDPGFLCCGSRRPGQDLLAMVLRRPKAADAEAAVLMRILLRLVDGLRARSPGAPAAQVTNPGGALGIPLGFVRGNAPAMVQVYRLIAEARRGDYPVLISGETGSGKEHLVRLLHDSSSRREGPFVPVNCAAIPAELLEAEMFGVGRGVATGVQERPGHFQVAHGGTLFLDEIGEMPLQLQPKLLRVLDRREVHPLGGGVVPVDVRVVAATNADLESRVAGGFFRADLYHRIGGFEIRVPPLRERREDIPALVERFLGRFCMEAGKRVRGVTVRALDLLFAYSWPGNVRELENEVRRLVVLCPSGRAIEASLLSERILQGVSGGPVALLSPFDLPGQVRALEERLIRTALDRCAGRQVQAAHLLNLSRNGLAKKMRRLGLRATPVRPGDP
jgi:transcriptional regulator with AAA-type ATPase domain